MRGFAAKKITLTIWGMLVLIPGVCVVAYAAVMLGAEALASGSWKSGIGWGLFIACGLGTVFWVSHLASANWALIIVTGFFLVVSVGSQCAFFDLAQDRLVRRVQSAADDVYPASWKGLAPAVCYQQWMAQVLDDPNAGGWWDHLSAQAQVGLVNTERADEFIEGQPGYRPVFRQGGWVYVNWLSLYVFVFIGCLLSLVGCAVWDRSVRKHERLYRMAQDEYERLKQELRDRGVPEQAIDTILNSSARNNILEQVINKKQLRDLLPGVEGVTFERVYQDLELLRIWHAHHNQDRAFDDERAVLAKMLLKKYYGGNLNYFNACAPWLLFLIAAHRLQCLDPEKDIWVFLRDLYQVLCVLGLYVQMPPMLYCNLGQMKYERINVHGQWAQLLQREANFYRHDSAWSALERMSVDDIPESAYLGIIYQYMFTPDRRVYEFWAGTEPSQLVAALGSRLRGALLTFIEREQEWYARNRSGYMDGLLSMASSWPYEEAAPLMEMALQAGWRRSCSGLPERAEWRALLERYELSPFGSPDAYVSWFKKPKNS